VARRHPDSDVDLADSAVASTVAVVSSPFCCRCREGDQLISIAYLICRVLLRAVVSVIRCVDAKDVEILVLRHQLEVLHRHAVAHGRYDDQGASIVIGS